MRQPPTIQQLIDEGIPLDKPIILVDPDTNWWLIPSFSFDEDKIFILADYGDKYKERSS